LDVLRGRADNTHDCSCKRSTPHEASLIEASADTGSIRQQKIGEVQLPFSLSGQSKSARHLLTPSEVSMPVQNLNTRHSIQARVPALIVPSMFVALGILAPLMLVALAVLGTPDAIERTQIVLNGLHMLVATLLATGLLGALYDRVLSSAFELAYRQREVQPEGIGAF
jgi:hypothetical protein